MDAFRPACSAVTCRLGIEPCIEPWPYCDVQRDTFMLLTWYLFFLEEREARCLQLCNEYWTYNEGYEDRIFAWRFCTAFSCWWKRGRPLFWQTRPLMIRCIVVVTVTIPVSVLCSSGARLLLLVIYSLALWSQQRLLLHRTSQALPSPRWSYDQRG
jgi:hypothetical protein